MKNTKLISIKYKIDINSQHTSKIASTGKYDGQTHNIICMPKLKSSCSKN